MISPHRTFTFLVVAFHKIQQINISGLYRKIWFYLQPIWGSPSCKASNPYGAEEGNCNEAAEEGRAFIRVQQSCCTTALNSQCNRIFWHTVDDRATFFVQDQKWAREKFLRSQGKKITKALSPFSFVWFSCLSENSRTENTLVEPVSDLNNQ